MARSRRPAPTVDVYFLSPSGKRLGAADALPAPIVALAISRDGQRIAAAGINGAVALIDRKTQNVVRTLVGPGMPVWSVAFLPDDRTLLTGGGDRAIRRWDAETGEPLDPPERGPEDPLAAYAGETGAASVSRLRGLPYAGTRPRQSRRP